MKKIAYKLYGIGAVSLLAIVILITLSLFILRHQMITDRVGQLRAMVESTRDIAKGFHDRQLKGEFDAATAQTLAKQVIRGLRYGANDYFFVYDIKGVSLLLPPKPDWEGQNKIDLKDPDGVFFIAELIKRAQNGGGAVHYRFPRAGSNDPVPKISYSLLLPDWDWVIGTGVYVDDIDIAFHGAVIWYGVIGVASIALLAIIILVLSRSLSAVISHLAVATRTIQRGDYSAEVPGVERRDEIGILASAIKHLRDDASAADRFRQDQQKMQNQADLDRKNALLALATQFETNVASVVTVMSDAVANAHQASQTMTQVASEAEGQATSVSGSSETVYANKQSVSAATEELQASISEIGRQISESASVAGQAVGRAQTTAEIIAGLASAVGKIGDIVQLINDIASQTNLLALNATIEAARAGDAGKGFAVVANEVKNLATQTARATQEITGQINAVQDATGNAVDAIDSIGSIINQINGSTAAIASAVEEQSAATQEISRSVNEAALGAQGAMQHVKSLAMINNRVAESADSVAKTSVALKSETSRLRQEVENFLKTVRS